MSLTQLRDHIALILANDKEHNPFWHATQPFLFIHPERRPSPYLARGVYTHLARAIDAGFHCLQLGSVRAKLGSNPTCYAVFSYPGGKLIPYFKEAARIDPILTRTLHFEETSDTLTVTVST